MITGLIVFLILDEAPECCESMFKLNHLIATLIAEYPLHVNGSAQLGTEHIHVHVIAAVCSVFIVQRYCALSSVISGLHQSCYPDQLHAEARLYIGAAVKALCCLFARLLLPRCTTCRLSLIPYMCGFASTCYGDRSQAVDCDRSDQLRDPFAVIIAAINHAHQLALCHMLYEYRGKNKFCVSK